MYSIPLKDNVVLGHIQLVYMANMRVIQATRYSLHKNLSCLCTYSLRKLCIAHCICKLNANKCDIFKQYCSYIFITSIILMNFNDAVIIKIDEIITYTALVSNQLATTETYLYMQAQLHSSILQDHVMFQCPN